MLSHRAKHYNNVRKVKQCLIGNGGTGGGGAAGPGTCMRPPPPRVLKDSGAGWATNKCPYRKLSGAKGANFFFHTMCLYSKYSEFCGEFIFVLKQQEKFLT